MENLDFERTLHFDEFPPISTEEWESVIEEDLKGKDYKEVLRWKSGEGVEPLPFYRRENLRRLEHQANPVRKSGSWRIMEPVENTDVQSANKKAIHALENGASGLLFCPPKNYLNSKKDLKSLLEHIQIELIDLHFVSSLSSPQISTWMSELCNERGLSEDELSVSFNFDPLSYAIISGKLADKSAIKQIIDAFGDSFKYCAVDSALLANAGANIIEQLAFALAAGNEYLGMKPETASNLHFNFASGPNYFLEIAKFRAFKLAWSQVLGEYGLNDIEPYLSAETSLWNKSKTDAHNNMLRTTSEAMSAAIAGCDSVTVHRYDYHFDEDSSFASRIARNIQIILQEEAHLDKVADPGAGSYYIEVLTDSIAEKSWKLFREIEQKGGFHECLKSGFIQKLISESRQKKVGAYNNKERVLVGVNKYHPEEESSSSQFQLPISIASEFDGDQVTNIPKVELLNIEAELQKGEE